MPASLAAPAADSPGSLSCSPPPPLLVAQGETELHFYLGDRLTELRLVPGLVGVQRPPAKAASLAQDLSLDLPSWKVAGESPAWTLFAHPSASAEARLLPGWQREEGGEPPADTLLLIAELAEKHTDPDLLFTPLLLDDAGFGLLVGSEIMIRFREGTPEQDALDLIAKAGAVVVPGRLELLERGYLLRVEGAHLGAVVLETANWLAEQPIVEWSQPNFSVHGVEPSGDCVPLSPSPTQSELNQNWWDDGTWGINASGAWALCGGADAGGQPLVTVGIIGEGIDLTHPDLSLPMIGEDFVTDGPAGVGGAPATTCDNHETAVAGMLAMAANGSGGVGAAPRIRIASARAHYSTQGQPNCVTPLAQLQSDVCDAILWLSTTTPSGAGARVISYSWNAFTSNICLQTSIDEAFEQRDVLFFASVGNKNQANVQFPTSLIDHALGVGAIDQLGRRWVAAGNFGSNFGPGLRYAAPGSGLFTTDRQGAAGSNPDPSINGNWVPPPLPGWQGTSFATPLVAGVAALIRSLRPDLDATAVDTILCTTAVKDLPFWDHPPIDDPRVEPLPECGLVNATAALEYALTFAPLFSDDFESGDLDDWSEAAPP